MKIFYIIILLLFINLSSCQIGECGSDIRLGNYQLSEESKQFIPYSGNEELVFVDEQGIEHILKSIDGKNMSETRSIARTTCSNGFFDSQYEYYRSQREEIVFKDSYGNQFFWISLLTFILNEEDTNRNTIFDLLIVNC